MKFQIVGAGNIASDSAEVETALDQIFQQNFHRLRAESGHALSPEVRRAAWLQVLLYWWKLRAIAESITDTEVKLNLANQVTPKGRRFCIEGIVDIVRAVDRVTMYDLKTHDLEFVKANIDFYRKQLNVYAHIWQNLRGERLDEMAVICTTIPERVRDAFDTGDQAELSVALTAWDPVVPIEFDQGSVDQTIREFGQAVDDIEDGRFAPPKVGLLRRMLAKRQNFARRVCQNCDGRFSCKSYREYADAPRRRNATSFLPFFDILNEEGEREAWRAATIPDGRRPEELVGDL